MLIFFIYFFFWGGGACGGRGGVVCFLFVMYIKIQVYTIRTSYNKELGHQDGVLKQDVIQKELKIQGKCDFVLKELRTENIGKV